MTKVKDNCQNHEHERNALRLTINGKRYHWDNQYITGIEIKNLGKIEEDEDVFLAIKKPWEDEEINDDTKVNLARPEIEHFFSKCKDKEFTIIVNGTPKKWTNKEVSFKDVIILAYGNYIDKPTMVYTVAFEDGPKKNPEGSMVKESTVFIKNKMIFHATATDKS